MIRAAALLALLAAGPAGAVGLSDELTRCAAFWYGAADFRARQPRIGGDPESALALAQAFRDRAVALSGAAGAVDAEIARDRRDMERMVEAYVFGADAETIALWERTATRCETLASSQAG